MIDLVCVVADRNMEATLESVLRRPDAIPMRSIAFEVLVHPEHDSGCFHNPEALLNGYVARARHALVLLDHAWDGVPEPEAESLEASLRKSLDMRFGEGWARPIAIAPELEAWVFGPSPHVAAVLGWNSLEELHVALEGEGLWPADMVKPPDPKGAMEWALRRTRQPRSSAHFRELGEKVSFRRCQDAAFRRLLDTLSTWFPPGPARGPR